MKVPVVDREIILNSKKTFEKVGIPLDVEMVGNINFIPIFKGRISWQMYVFDKEVVEGRKYVYGGCIDV